MFSIMGIFSLPLIFKNIKNIFTLNFNNRLYHFILAAILLSGNRMPIIMFLIFLIMMSIFVKKNNIKAFFTELAYLF